MSEPLQQEIDESLTSQHAPSIEFETVKIKMLPDGRLSAIEAAKYLGRAVSSMAIDRTNGVGCPFVKIGGKIWYWKSDLDQYIASHRRITSTAQNSQPLRAL